jgi:ElaB/YqjD/DUF883 family membrane-anchored ribosome-binding protein
MAIDRDLLRMHHSLFGLMSDALVAMHTRIMDLGERTNGMNTTLQGIKSDLADMDSKLDQLIAAKGMQDAADEAEIKASIETMTAKVTAALSTTSTNAPAVDDTTTAATSL